MKTVSKKLLCLLMAVFLLAAAIPFQALAAETPVLAADTPKTHKLTLILKDSDGNQLAEPKVIPNKSEADEINSWEGVFTSHFGDIINGKYSEIEFSFAAADGSAIADAPTHVTQDMTVTATVTLKEIETKNKLTIHIIGVATGEATLTTSPETPISKTEIQAEVEKVVGAGKYVLSYLDGPAGSPILSDYVSLKNGNVEIWVDTKLKDSPPIDTDKYIKLTLDANGGTIEGSYNSDLELVDGQATVPTLPKASKSGYDFVGWYVGDDLLEAGDKLSADTTAVAKYSLKTKNLLVKGVKSTQNAENATLISEYNVPVGTSLLDFVKEEKVTAAVRNSVPAGYYLDNNNGAILWYTSDGKSLIGQEKATNVAQTVLVKYVANTYTLYFQVDGGSVSPTSKQVTFDQKVGTLPTPIRKGDVFQGWYDADDNLYTKDTVYKVAGDTTLTARWQSEADVRLRIYLEDDLSEADRVVDITSKVIGNTVTRSEVEKIILKRYSAKPGKTMKLVGLFNDATWEDYKAGKITKGDPNVTVQENEKVNVYVVVKNAKEGGSSTTGTTKPVDKSNPKTGDTMLIYPAAAVMVLAAAALVTVQVVRKKKEF